MKIIKLSTSVAEQEEREKEWINTPSGQLLQKLIRQNIKGSEYLTRRGLNHQQLKNEIHRLQKERDNFIYGKELAKKLRQYESHEN